MQEGDSELVDICLVLVCMNSKMMKGGGGGGGLEHYYLCQYYKEHSTR